MSIDLLYILSVSDTCLCLAVRSGFLHLAEALAYRIEIEVPLIAIIAMLKSGERCNAEPELIEKGMNSVTEDHVTVYWICLN